MFKEIKTNLLCSQQQGHKQIFYSFWPCTYFLNQIYVYGLNNWIRNIPVHTLHANTLNLSEYFCQGPFKSQS